MEEIDRGDVLVRDQLELGLGRGDGEQAGQLAAERGRDVGRRGQVVKAAAAAPRHLGQELVLEALADAHRGHRHAGLPLRLDQRAQLLGCR